MKPRSSSTPMDEHHNQITNWKVCQPFSSEKYVMGILEMHACFKLPDGMQVQIFLFSKFLIVRSTTMQHSKANFNVLAESDCGPRVC